MFERFTDRSRKVLVLAQEEARLLDHNFLGTEHLLLGLMHEGDGVAAKALQFAGLDLLAIRDRVAELVPPASAPDMGVPPFTPPAKKVLELALREALQLGHNYIGTEHLLLGLVREGDTMAARVLVDLGVDLSHLRGQVVQLLSGSAFPTHQHTATSVPVGPASGPRCPSCRAPLRDRVGYRVLPVPNVGAASPAEPIDVVMIYCLTCGVVVAHRPAAEVGAAGTSPAPG